jgi:pimeloyl-ACP methyl ester carboxylesterase
MMSEAIEKFEIRIPDAVLDDLKQRLARARFPDQIPDTGWEYGMPLACLQPLVEHWRERYDWRAQERALNRLEHFRTRIDGQSIHFAHVHSRHAGAFPLIISHGWPGTIAEFLKIVGPLTDPEAHGGRAQDAFHLVLPSLPGYGFSEPTRTRGWDTRRIAEAFAELMRRLGYARYGAQGGDWGAMITSNLALVDPQHVAAIHTNMPMARPPDQPGELSEREKADLADMARFGDEESGYQRIQGTKPQTLGVGLNDSPVGLCAWIVEKFKTWSDCGDSPENSFTKDELLTNVMLYWVTQTITSSTRLYYETFKRGRVGLEKRIEVPTGVARFPKEVMRFPRAWVERQYNVTRWTEMPRGGHFAAMEVPELFVRDVRAFFATIRG